MPLELPAVDVSTVPVLGAGPTATGSSSLTDPENPPLGGNSLERINNVARVILVASVLVTLLGVLLGWFFSKTSVCSKWKLNKRPPLWSIFLLLLSYALLIPGLFGTLFEFNIFVDVMHIIKLGVGPGGGINKYPGIDETMIGLIKMLADTGSMVGAILVVIYAIVIPVTKLGLLVVGECGRHARPKLSRRCVQVLQNISKWACPDMFAYILLLHLVRGINHPPLLRAAGQLDIGFTCFSVFCLGSTIAAMGVHAPDREHGCFKWLASKIGRRGLAAMVAVLTPLFFVLLGIGISQPVMALRVVLEALYEPNGPIPKQFAPVVNNLHIPELANADVSFVANLQALLGWVQAGEWNSAVAFAMVAVFVLGCTALDMLVLSVATCTIFMGSSAQELMPVIWVLKKLSMLDVALMGVIVVTMCMYMYKKDGVVVSMCSGMFWLGAAELIHYFVYYTVKGTLESVEVKGDHDESSEDSTHGELDSEDSEASVTEE